MFGVRLARLYVSESDALPIAAARTTTRSSPVRRESSVPAATATLERARPARPRLGSSIAALTSPARAWTATRTRPRAGGSAASAGSDSPTNRPRRRARRRSSPTAQPPNTADRTVTRTGAPNASRPSGDVTLIVIGNVPDARASTLKRMVLLPGLRITDWSAPFGKISFGALEMDPDRHVARGLRACSRSSAAPRPGAT